MTTLALTTCWSGNARHARRHLEHSFGYPRTGHWLPNERVRRIAVGLIYATSFALKASRTVAVSHPGVGIRLQIRHDDSCEKSCARDRVHAHIPGRHRRDRHPYRDFAERRDRAEQAAAYAGNAEPDRPISRMRTGFPI